MGHNLRHEMRDAIYYAFSEHTDKHDLKAKGMAEGKIFSYGRRNALLDRANDFSKYCNTLGVNRVNAVTPGIVQGYLDSKAGSCTQRTLDEYRGQLKTIGGLCGVNMVCSRVYADRPADAARGAASVISTEDYAKILDYAESHPSGSAVCVRLEQLIGIRVSDMAYGIQVQENTLKIRSKNGKILTRGITPEIRQIIDSGAFKELLEGTKVRAPKDGSINRWLNRVEDKLGIERHSFHDLRRYVAQSKYNELRNSGLNRSEALSAVSVWLNHGSNRDETMLKSYIHDAW